MRVALLAWLAVGLVIALLAQVALDHLWILSFIPILAWAVAGLVILFIVLWRARRPEGRRRWAALSALGVVSGWLLFLPVAQIGNSLTSTIRFALQRSAYEQVVTRELSRVPTEGRHEFAGLRYIVDAGPPLRIAFVWPGGIIDNWCGAIYDPTGMVMRSNDFDGEWETWYEQVPWEVIKLFDGDLVYCDELAAPYYRCCFT